MFRTWPNTCQHACLHPGEPDSFPLAVFPEDRWLRRKAHIVFALQAMGMLCSESPKHTSTKHKPSFISFRRLVKKKFFQIQSVRGCKLRKGLNWHETINPSLLRLLKHCNSEHRVWQSIFSWVYQDLAEIWTTHEEDQTRK